MKLFSVISTLLLIGASASAHIENGIYKGKTDAGDVCEMQANRTYFEGELKHPLNERVELVVNALTYQVGHPPLIDETAPMAAFDHDQFKGSYPLSTGAMGLVVKMTHAEGKEGPTEYYLISHQYRQDTRTVIKCSGLVLVR